MVGHKKAGLRTTLEYRDCIDTPTRHSLSSKRGRSSSSGSGSDYFITIIEGYCKAVPKAL